jgi:hypothetical protein
VTARAGTVAVLLLAVSVAGCGSSQPSSAVEVAATPASSTAVASVEPPASGPPASGPAASSEPASPTAAAKPPPKPANTTFKHVDTKPGPKKFTFTETYKITWTEPKGVADSFLVYGMTDCPRFSKKNQGTPCVVRGMPIDVDKLTQLSVVPGDKRSTTVSWDIGEVDVPPYSAILMRAVNDAGNSIFTIVKSYDVCYQCTY